MSSENDPFAAFESDRTIIKPSAGRGARAPAAPGAAAPAAVPQPPLGAAAPDAAPLADVPQSAGLDPLVQAASLLLSAAPRIRAMPQHPNPAGLRDALAEGVRRFEATARAAGVPNEQVVAARYVLCTFLDEAASSTPWGGSGVWGSQSLLVQFHNEAWGGEKVFQLLARLAENPQGQRPLLELLNVVLALGFEGRFRVIDNGRAQLEGVRERLAQLLRQHRPPADPELSPHWRGVAAAAVRLRDGMPLWVAASALALVLAVVFVVLRLAINRHTDPVFQSLQALDVKASPPPPVAVAAPAVPAAPPAPRLAQFLKPEIDAKQIAVRDLAARSIVTIAGDGFFDPGSAEVAPRVRPLLDRIGAAVAGVGGSVLVTGHTDNQPIRSLRYPSNWHLSKDRAEAVKALLAAHVKPDRLRAEGRADSEPVDDAPTAAARARNRRVEITVHVPQPA